MDMSKEASIDPFSLGPTTACDRCAALQVLLYGSVKHFIHHRFLRAAFHYFFKLRNYAKTYVWWLPPRNPLGMLILCILISIRFHWLKSFKFCKKYDKLADATEMLENENDIKANDANDADLYDVELVKNKVVELRRLRENGHIKDIVFYIRADMVRNFGNICNPEIYKGRRHVPEPIRNYTTEMIRQLRMVCTADSKDLPLEEKLSFMDENRHAFGRTALILSGGATLGAFHIGVVETLVVQRLLPRIIAGSSVGSIMASVICTRSWVELEELLQGIPFRFFTHVGSILSYIERIRITGAVCDITLLQSTIRNLTCNMTFEEAYAATGRILGITVCSTRKHEPPRLLNYINSPRVFIWSAVTASCAFPGLFEPQELMAKDMHGKTVAYQPEEVGGSKRLWRDGSLEADLPIMQLRELFNANYFIVSQANPHIAPLLRMKEYVRKAGNFTAKIAKMVELEVKHKSNQMMEFGFPIGKLFAQDWEGDVTIVMSATLMQYLKIIKNPTESDLKKAVEQGRRCTLEKIPAINALYGIELALDECVNTLNQTKRMKRSAERAAATASPASTNTKATTSKIYVLKRTPSWNCLARDHSAGSVDEETIVTNRNSLHRQNSYDSDSESEHPHISWTKMGGPLMRTVSAEEVTKYLRSTVVKKETSSEECGSKNEEVVCVNSSNSRVAQDSAEFDQNASSSILVTSGDLLEVATRITGDGRMKFNLVKRDSFIATPSNEDHNHDLSNGTCTEPAECMQLECSDGDIDTTSVSEEGSDTEDRER